MSVLLPPLYDKNTQAVESDTQVEEDEIALISNALRPANKSIGYCDLLCNARFLLASFTSAMALMCTSYCTPIFANEMKQQFHLNQEQISYAFGSFSISYILALSVLDSIPKDTRPRSILIYGFIFLTVGSVLAGPSSHLHLPKFLWLMFVGNCTLQMAAAFQLVYCLTEMIAASMEQG